MSGPPVVLDSAGLATLAENPGHSRLRAVLAEAAARGRDVQVPAVVCAEVCRGMQRTRQVEAALARHTRDRADRPAVEVVDTTFELARQVGAILHAAGAGTADLVDAHVLALCVRAGGGLVVTSDPADIARLSAATPAVRIIIATI
ncbi:MAG: type II toxin-antitoxin system VapC family toxin [Ilumatobacteraceae bacterium]